MGNNLGEQRFEQVRNGDGVPGPGLLMGSWALEVTWLRRSTDAALCSQGTGLTAGNCERKAVRTPGGWGFAGCG